MDPDNGQMDWSPTVNVWTRGVKRRSDGTMVYDSPYTAYPARYMPGGWIPTPPQYGLFDRPETPRPDSYAKKICVGLVTATASMANSMKNSMHGIVRNMKNINRPRVHRRNTQQMRRLPPMAPPSVAPQTPIRQIMQPVTQKPAPPVPATPMGAMPFYMSEPEPIVQVLERTPLKSSQYKSHIVDSLPQTAQHPPRCLKLEDSPNWPIISPGEIYMPSARPPSSAARQLQADLNQFAAEFTQASPSAQLQNEYDHFIGELQTSSRVQTPPASPTETELSSTVPDTTPQQQRASAQVPSSPTESEISSTVPETSLNHKWFVGTPLESSPLPLPATTEISSRWLEWADTPAEPSPPTAPVTTYSPKSDIHSGYVVGRETRAASKKIAAARHAKCFTLDPLSRDWEVKVEKALKNGHGSYSADDLLRLVPPIKGGTNAWLNDEVINGYLKIICQHGNKDQKSGEIPHYHAFNSFFMSNLISKGPDGVRRWATRAGIGGKKIARLDKIFIPVNSGSHWTLLVVSPQTKEITHYNSMSGSDSKRYIAKVVEWLQVELGKDFSVKDWNLTPVGESPQQKNYSDCGVFTITTAKQIMLGHGVMSYGDKQIETQRRRIVAELIACELLRSK